MGFTHKTIIDSLLVMIQSHNHEMREMREMIKFLRNQNLS